jgi:hypothetical protein
VTAEVELFSYSWFVCFPLCWLCLQYGWDMIFDDIVPMAARHKL